jgi:SAM-dependent methyltransferase
LIHSDAEMSGQAGRAAILRRHTLIRGLVYRAGRPRGHAVARWIHPMLHPAQTVVDIGAGTGNVTEALRERGFDVTAVDVVPLSFTDGVEPLLYDGEHLPFADGVFDAALLSTVLHHAARPAALLREAGRVAPCVVVVEDVHRGRLHREISSLLDRLISLELEPVKHGYRSDAGWRRLFAAVGLRVTASRRAASLGIFRHIVYRLERQPPASVSADRSGSRRP